MKRATKREGRARARLRVGWSEDRTVVELVAACQPAFTFHSLAYYDKRAPGLELGPQKYGSANRINSQHLLAGDHFRCRFSPTR
jgi:hypothetical protein